MGLAVSIIFKDIEKGKATQIVDFMLKLINKDKNYHMREH